MDFHNESNELLCCIIWNKDSLLLVRHLQAEQHGESDLGYWFPLTTHDPKLTTIERAKHFVQVKIH